MQSNCSTFDVIVFESLCLEDEVFLADNCIASKMKAVFYYFYMLCCLGNILFGIFVLAMNFRKSRQFTLHQCSYILAIICACARLIYFALRLASVDSFATYFLIYFPNILLLLIMAIFCFNWVRIVLRVSSFMKNKGLPKVLKYAAGALFLTVLLMIICMPALVAPSYTSRTSISMHNILMAAASLAISTFQLCFVGFMWFIGEKLVRLMDAESHDETLKVKQRIMAFKVRLMIYSVLGFLVSLTFTIWAAVTFNGNEGMKYSYYLVQTWWLQDILGVFAVLYTSFQKLDKGGSNDEGSPKEKTNETLERKPVVVVHDGGSDNAPKKKRSIHSSGNSESSMGSEQNANGEEVQMTRLKKVVEASPSMEFDEQLDHLSSFLKAVPTVATPEEIKKERDLTLQRQKQEKEKKEVEVERRRLKAKEKQRELEEAIRQAEVMEMEEKTTKDKPEKKEKAAVEESSDSPDADKP